jgi:hypothetical protein
LLCFLSLFGNKHTYVSSFDHSEEKKVYQGMSFLNLKDFVFILPIVQTIKSFMTLRSTQTTFSFKLYFNFGSPLGWMAAYIVSPNALGCNIVGRI